MTRPRCSNCHQLLLPQSTSPEPCGSCGYLGGGIEMVEDLEGEPAGPSQFRRLVWWMAVVVVTIGAVGILWLLLNFQNSGFNTSQGL